MPKPVTDLPDSQVSPAPASEKRTRRRFSTEYKLRIITEAEASERGELGALLRRENLYCTATSCSSGAVSSLSIVCKA